ncbi:hypothetical protein IW261DRAFT_657967 [Armillaria novae-zelandiae]|uniref:FAD-binding FR-type domain-containing protein n=1 Tax=Armillaria novae-zelandiae TaxID=153914 RepID=A0AA39UHQ6_9AGAR|nr:hypothetical protein IW261DRAFT_829818 [Armillaria novae-zelandiae]KAK0487978.1 hypothetical protein IW261DRAFT_657967 [Armillaria novae-zelandiae]
MFLQDRLTTIHVTGYIFVRDALPVRQRPGTTVQRSPYSPPVRPLVEESAPILHFDDAASPAIATLKSILLHSPTIATFTWQSSVELDITPGQAIILDLSGFIGRPGYQHMSRNPTSVNDDRVRTWTVSSSSHPVPTDTFSITIREKPGGAATGALFTLARRIAEVRPALLRDMAPVALTIPIMGVTGEFTLQRASKRVALFAGGIGVTPFLSMLGGVRGGGGGDGWDVVLVLSTREPEVLLPLVWEVVKEVNGVLVHVFSDKAVPNAENIIAHRGRVTSRYLVERREDWVGRDVFVCGPESYRESVIGGLVEAGVEKGTVRTETFEY